MRLATAVLLVLLAALPAGAGVDELPCVLCHPSRDRAVFETLKSTPGVQVGGESGQAFVCWSCHNGSVRDDRQLLLGAGQHPNAFRPDRAMPKGYPLYAGNLDCGTCHSPHGKGPAARRWLRGPDERDGNCRACHAGRKEEFHLGRRLAGPGTERIAALGGALGPGGQITCSTCHRVHGGSSSHLLVASYGQGREDLCFACHAGMRVAGGEGAAVHPCASCHKVHARADGPGAQSRGDCGTCHSGRSDRHAGAQLSKEALARVEALGGRSAGGKIGCPTCHRIHGAAGRKLLISPSGPDRAELCRICHAELSTKGKPPGEGANCYDCHRPHVDAPLQWAGKTGPCVNCHPERKGTGEHGSASAMCSDCHSVHRPSSAPKAKAALLKAALEGGGLCQPCHQEKRGLHGTGQRVTGANLVLISSSGIALGPDATVQCSSCHRMHGAKKESLLALARPVLCLYCHPKQNPFGPEGAREGAHPVAVFLRASQKKILAAKGGTGEPGAALECTSCHDPHGPPTASGAGCSLCHPSNAPAEKHGGKQECKACHDIHGGSPPEASCTACHPETLVGVHSALAGSASGPKFTCFTCHDPHGPQKALLRAGSAEAACLGCHEGKATVRGGAHDASGKGWLCSPCHRAHGAPEGGGLTLAERCQSCHTKATPVRPGHSPSGTPAWKRLKAPLPLFSRAGARNAYGLVTCATCHDVHLGQGTRALRLEPNDPPKLCLACHPEKESILKTAHDPRGKGGGAACTACHPTHGETAAPAFWALRSDAQGTWNDRMCSACHGPPTVAPKPHAGAGSHPVNVAAPASVKPGVLPLFDPVGRPLGRLVGCPTCHDLHGTPGAGGPIAKFLRKEVRTGELCATCHERQAAVVGTAHDMREKGQTSIGPCGPCHSVHASKSRRLLWGLEPQPGEYLPNTLCRSCHRQNGPVRGEFLLMQYHMKDAEDLRTERGTTYLQRPMLLTDEWSGRTGQPPVIALYDKAGNSLLEGNLQCVSCHEPHQWSPMGAFVKPGIGNVGPNVATHFLRLRSAQEAEKSVCASCHPKDASERYLQYHSVWEDVGTGFQ